MLILFISRLLLNAKLTFTTVLGCCKMTSGENIGEMIRSMTSFRNVITVVFALSIVLLVVLPALQSCATEKYVLFILDTSGSMNGDNLRIAKKVLLQSIKERPYGTEIALRVFNQKARTLDESCTESELILDFNEYDAVEVKKTLDGIGADGQSPLANTLDESVYDFPERKPYNSIVLITDGRETCGGDPCDRAASLRKHNGVVVHVIALAVDEFDKKHLKCINERAGGEYFDVINQKELLKSISSLLDLPTSPLVVKLVNENGDKLFGTIEIYNDSSELVASTTNPLREFSPTLPIGTYSVTAEVDGKESMTKVIRLKEEKPTEVIFIFKTL